MYNDEFIIRQLIDRFMEGKTTPEENDKIANWFKEHPCVSDDLKDYQAMFGYFEAGMPWDFDASILEKNASVERKAGNRKYYLRPLWIAVAASIALALLVFYPHTQNVVNETSLAVINKNDSIDETTNPSPQELLNETENVQRKVPGFSRKKYKPVKVKQNREYHKKLFEPASPVFDLAEASSSDIKTNRRAVNVVNLTDLASYSQQLADKKIEDVAGLTDMMADKVLEEMLARQENIISTLFAEDQNMKCLMSQDFYDE